MEPKKPQRAYVQRASSKETNSLVAGTSSCSDIFFDKHLSTDGDTQAEVRTNIIQLTPTNPSTLSLRKAIQRREKYELKFNSTSPNDSVRKFNPFSSSDITHLLCSALCDSYQLLNKFSVKQSVGGHRDSTSTLSGVLSIPIEVGYSRDSMIIGIERAPFGAQFYDHSSFMPHPSGKTDEGKSTEACHILGTNVTLTESFGTFTRGHNTSGRWRRLIKVDCLTDPCSDGSSKFSVLIKDSCPTTPTIPQQDFSYPITFYCNNSGGKNINCGPKNYNNQCGEGMNVYSCKWELPGINPLTFTSDSKSIITGCTIMKAIRDSVNCVHTVQNPGNSSSGITVTLELEPVTGDLRCLLFSHDYSMGDIKSGDICATEVMKISAEYDSDCRVNYVVVHADGRSSRFEMQLDKMQPVDLSAPSRGDDEKSHILSVFHLNNEEVSIYLKRLSRNTIDHESDCKNTISAVGKIIISGNHVEIDKNDCRAAAVYEGSLSVEILEQFQEHREDNKKTDVVSYVGADGKGIWSSYSFTSSSRPSDQHHDIKYLRHRIIGKWKEGTLDTTSPYSVIWVVPGYSQPSEGNPPQINNIDVDNIGMSLSNPSCYDQPLGVMRFDGTGMDGINSDTTSPNADSGDNAYSSSAGKVWWYELRKGEVITEQTLICTNSHSLTQQGRWSLLVEKKKSDTDHLFIPTIISVGCTTQSLFKVAIDDIPFATSMSVAYLQKLFLGTIPFHHDSRVSSTTESMTSASDALSSYAYLMKRVEALKRVSTEVSLLSVTSEQILENGIVIETMKAVETEEKNKRDALNHSMKKADELQTKITALSGQQNKRNDVIKQKELQLLNLKEKYANETLLLKDLLKSLIYNIKSIAPVSLSKMELPLIESITEKNESVNQCTERLLEKESNEDAVEDIVRDVKSIVSISLSAVSQELIIRTDELNKNESKLKTINKKIVTWKQGLKGDEERPCIKTQIEAKGSVKREKEEYIGQLKRRYSNLETEVSCLTIDLERLEKQDSTMTGTTSQLDEINATREFVSALKADCEHLERKVKRAKKKEDTPATSRVVDMVFATESSLLDELSAMTSEVLLMQSVIKDLHEEKRFSEKDHQSLHKFAIRTNTAQSEIDQLRLFVEGLRCGEDTIKNAVSTVQHYDLPNSIYPLGSGESETHNEIMAPMLGSATERRSECLVIDTKNIQEKLDKGGYSSKASGTYTTMSVADLKLEIAKIKADSVLLNDSLVYLRKNKRGLNKDTKKDKEIETSMNIIEEMGSSGTRPLPLIGISTHVGSSSHVPHTTDSRTLLLQNELERLDAILSEMRHNIARKKQLEAKLLVLQESSNATALSNALRVKQNNSLNMAELKQSETWSFANSFRALEM